MIRFLNTREHNVAEIHHQLCEIYGPTAMSEGKVRQMWISYVNAELKQQSMQ